MASKRVRLIPERVALICPHCDGSVVEERPLLRLREDGEIEPLLRGRTLDEILGMLGGAEFLVLTCDRCGIRVVLHLATANGLWQPSKRGQQKARRSEDPNEA